MSTITVRARLRAKPGREAELEQWMAEITAVVRDGDPGTLAYGFYRDDRDGSYVAIEQYDGTDGVVGHFANAGATIAKLGDVVEPGDDPLEVYGDPSAEVREIYSAWGPVFFGRLG